MWSSFLDLLDNLLPRNGIERRTSVDGDDLFAVGESQFYLARSARERKIDAFGLWSRPSYWPGLPMRSSRMNRNSAESRSDQLVCKRFVVRAGPYRITGSEILGAHGIGAAVIGLNLDRREALSPRHS